MRSGACPSNAAAYAGPITFMSGISRFVFGAANRIWIFVPVGVASSSMVWSTLSGPSGVARIVRSVT